MSNGGSEQAKFDVFLSHSHEDAGWVEALAERLTDHHGLTPWLDKWVLIPGQPWQQHMARGIETAGSCAVCVGQSTPERWFKMEIEKALNRQGDDPSFRVMAVLIPGADPEAGKKLIGTFLDLNTWVDFNAEADHERAYHTLVCGIKGIPPGRWRPSPAQPQREAMVKKLRELRELYREKLIHESVVLEYERKILEPWLESS